MKGVPVQNSNAAKDAGVNVCSSLFDIIREAEQGDVIGLFGSLKPVPSDDGVETIACEYYWAAVLFASSSMKMLTRFYRGEQPGLLDPTGHVEIQPVVGTTLLQDDDYITLVSENGMILHPAHHTSALLLKQKRELIFPEFIWALN